jgi:hypothetical protein
MKWARNPKFFLGAVAIPIVLAVIGWVYTRPPNHIGAISNNQGIITQGQKGGNNTVNPVLRERPHRLIDDELKKALLAYIPKSKHVQITVLIGDDPPERDAFADQIESFLRDNGYSVVQPRLSFLPGSGSRTPIGTNIHPDAKDPNLMVIQIGVNNREM